MAGPAVRWLESQGMTVKSEFVAPWGICDHVGLRFNDAHVQSRLELKQTKPVSSITRAAVLLNVPDQEKKRSITVQSLAKRFPPLITEDTVREEIDRLVAERFVVRCGRGFQKVNGWMPLHDKLVALELKLSRIDEVLCQAFSNLGFADESYVGLPADVAQRVASKRSRWSKYFDEGVGLLSVSPHSCEILIPAASEKSRWLDPALQFYCVEKFWRTRPRGS